MARRLEGRSLGVNTAANFVTQFVAPALSLLLIPVYVHFLGLGGYGLVALLAALLSFAGVFTRGLGWSLQREVAQAHVVGDHGRLLALVRTFEISYWVIGAVLGAALAVLSSSVSGTFDNSNVGRDTVHACLLVLAVRLAALFPLSVYQATLLGTRRQVLLNAANSVMLLLGTAATVTTVALTGSLVGLYVADLITAAVSLLVLRWLVLRTSEPAPDGAPAHLSLTELRLLARLSAGLVWTQAVGMVTRQLDRFVVGGLTSLASLGVYSAGVAAGRLLSLSYNPYLTAVFPESCALALREPSAMPSHLLRNSKIVALASIGVGVPVALAGRELLTVWVGDGRIVTDGYPVLVVYVIGSIFLALADTQYQVHTAMGTSRCGVWVNSVAVVWLPVVMIFLVKEFGIVGAADTWLLYAASTWLVFTGYTFGKLMPGHLTRYLAAMAVPAAICVVLDAALAVGARALVGDGPWAFLAVMVPGAALVLALATITSLGPTTTRALLLHRS